MFPASKLPPAGLALVLALSCRGGGGPPPSPIKVTIVEPLAGTSVSGTVAVAADVIGGVDPVSVTISVGNQIRATLDAPPYLTGIDLQRETGKTVTLTVSARDAAGNSAQDRVTLQVDPNQPANADAPRIEVVRPADGATVCGDTLIEARATDGHGISKLVLYLDGKVVHQVSGDLLRWLWPTRAVADGEHALALEGRDARGVPTVARWRVEVDNHAAVCPADLSVEIEQPAEGALVTGSVSVRARVAGQTMAPVVRFVADGAQFAVDDAAPFEATWNSGAFAEGPHRLRAVLTDEAGRQAVHEVGVSVDRSPPSLSITAPAEGAVVTGDVEVQIQASDAGELASVAVTVSRDGRAVADLGSRAATPLAFTWKTGGLAGGLYWIEAVATDSVGLTGTAKRSVRLGRALGAACGGKGECESGFCVDGVCCADACTGTCRRCATGQCAAVTGARDPDSCRGACDGMSRCKALAGDQCKATDECLTGACADGVCCDRACDGVCETCDAATGFVCTPVKDAPDGPICTGVRRCNAQSICLACASGPCEPGYSWTRTFPAISPSVSFTTDVAVGPDGAVAAVGNWRGTADFDLGPGDFRSSPSGTSSFIVKLDEGGNRVWGRFLIGSSIEASVVTVGRDGAVYVAGLFHGLTDLDPGSDIDLHDGGLGSTFSGDVFLIKLTAGGDYVWGRTLASGGAVELHGAQTTPQGNIVINGSFETDLDLDPGPGTDRTDATAGKGFLLTLSPGGDRVWSRQLMLINTNHITELSVGVDGAVAIGGQFTGTVDLDPTAGMDLHTSAGDMDAFVVKLDAAGRFLWARSTGGTAGENGFAVVDRAGNVYLGGITSGTFQADPLGPELGPRGNSLMGTFMVQYDRDGTYRWSHSLAGDRMIVPRRGIATATEGIVMTGMYAGNANFDPVGSRVIPSQGFQWFLMHWTPAGQLGWVKTFGHTSAGTRPRLAAVPWGGLVIGDSFDGTVDFDPGPDTAGWISDSGADGYVTLMGRY